MFNGQRVSRKSLALDALSIHNADDSDKYDDFGIPNSKRGGGKKGGLFNKFKKSKSSLAASENDSDEDDEQGTFEVVPGLPSGPYHHNMNASNSPHAASPAAVPPAQAYQYGTGPYTNAYSSETNNATVNGNHSVEQTQQNLYGQPNPLLQHQVFQQYPNSQMGCSLHSVKHTSSSSVSLHYQQPGNTSANSEISMDQIKSLRDRQRYPTVMDDPKTGPRMSLADMANYDSTPVIPLLGSHNVSSSKATEQDKYRQRMIDARRAVLSSATGVPVPGPLAPPEPLPNVAMGLPAGIGAGQSLPEFRTLSMNSMNSRMSFQPQHNQPPGNFMPGNMRPGPGYGPGGPGYGPGYGPGGPGGPQGPCGNAGSRDPNGPQPPPHSPGGPQLGSVIQTPQVNANVLQMDQNSPIGMDAYATQDYQRSTVPPQIGLPDLEDLTDFDFGPAAKSPDPYSPSTTTKDVEIDNEKIRAMEDDIRVLSIELAESVRREQRLEPNNEETESAAAMANAFKELSLERTKRQTIEKAAKSRDIDPSVHEELAEMKYRHGEAVHLLSIRTEQYEALQSRHSALESDFSEKQRETTELNNRIQSKEVSQEVFEQDQELTAQVKMLMEVNAKLRQQLDQVSDRGPLGSRVRVLEDQRSALQEALRAMRDRKDAEIKMLNNRIQSLTQGDGQHRLSANSHGSNFRSTSTSSLLSNSEGTRTLFQPTARRVGSVVQTDEDVPLSLPKFRDNNDTVPSRSSSPLHIGLDYAK